MTSQTIQPGMTLIDDRGIAEVMAVADGYMMVRRPYCAPFVLSVKDIGKKWSIAQGGIVQ